MSAVKVLGTSNPVETKVTREVSDREAAVVEVAGLYADLDRANPANYCPSGMTVESSQVSSTEDGMGKLTIRCVKYDSGLDFSSVRTTFRVTMEAVQYDLEDHPYLAGSPRNIILMWLATDESKRIDDQDYKFENKDGTLEKITDNLAKKFCSAYMSGIRTFNRYFPVIEKISVWKNPPGLNRNGRSFSGGSPSFSGNAGTFDAPPISLNGFAPTNWFKSGDGWQENADKTWTRTEQWTYTPEGSSSEHAWIYEEL